MKTTFFDPNKFNKIINRGLGLECEAEGGRGGRGGGGGGGGGGVREKSKD